MGFLLPVVFSPSVQATFWTPAAALCLVIAAVGLPRLVALAAARTDHAARLALAFVALSTVATSVSRRPALSFFGLYLWGTGLLFVLALTGAWAIGRRLTEAGSRLVERVILAAALLNAAIAAFEMRFDLSALELGKYGGRAPGLLGNPVHLAGLCAAATVLAASRFARGSRWWGASITLLALGVQVAGGRAGLALLIVAVLIGVATSTRRRTALAVLAVAGLVAGAGLTSLGGGVALSNRVRDASGAGGYGPRIATWRAAGHAIVDRPLVGVGPGLFRDAVAPRRAHVLATQEGTERMFVDAHDIFVEYATTTGLLGLAALCGWLWLAIRGARGPLLWFALLLLANHLVQPQAVRTTPVAFLALGAAAATIPGRERAARRWETTATVVLAGASVIAAGVLLVGDFHLDQGRLDFVRPQADAADRLLGWWPEPAVLEGRISLFQERLTRDPRDAEAAIVWFREAAQRDTGNPLSWNTLGATLLAQGRSADARAAFGRALRANPISVVAMNGMAAAWSVDGRRDAACVWYTRSLRTLDQPRLRTRVRDCRLDAARGRA